VISPVFSHLRALRPFREQTQPAWNLVSIRDERVTRILPPVEGF
jgi:hypothetical protein